MEDILGSERTCWGSPEEVRDSLINLAETFGANTLLLNFNQGAMPHDMFMQNLKRFGEEVLPAISEHKVSGVQVA